MYLRFSLEVIKLFRATRNVAACVEATKFFRIWSEMRRHRSPMQEKLPWITFGAIRVLDGHLRPGMKVFEYGSGGSTLYFARNGCVVESVEHNVEWYESVRIKIQQEGYRGVSTRLVPPAIPSCSTPPDKIYTSEHYSEYAGMSFRNYAGAIDQFQDATFDLVLVDGRARPGCVNHCMRKIRGGGMLVFDNSERPAYQESLAILRKQNFAIQDFYGPGPFLDEFWRTSIAIKSFQ